VKALLERPVENKKTVAYGVGIANWRDGRRVAIRLMVLLGDITAVTIAYACAFLIRFHYVPFINSFPVTKGMPAITDYLKAAPVILFMWALSCDRNWRQQKGHRKFNYADRIL
jgi:hypothetical protein